LNSAAEARPVLVESSLRPTRPLECGIIVGLVGLIITAYGGLIARPAPTSPLIVIESLDLWLGGAPTWFVGGLMHVLFLMGQGLAAAMLVQARGLRAPAHALIAGLAAGAMTALTAVAALPGLDDRTAHLLLAINADIALTAAFAFASHRLLGGLTR
jgi:hypothetical protein